MDNEYLYLCPTTSLLLIGALKCVAHLLPLLCPLGFSINAQNECVTLALIVINWNDNPKLFFDSLHHIPQGIFFAFGIWGLWLARNASTFLT